METEKEWHFVKNLTKKRTKKLWFIGLERVDGSHIWYWLSGTSPASTGHQLEHGVGIKENQKILEKKNAERCCKTESITTFRATQESILKIQDIFVKSKSVSS